MRGEKGIATPFLAKTFALIMALIVVGCAEKAPYEEVKLPNDDVISKDNFTLGVDEVLLDKSVDNVDLEIASVQSQVAEIDKQITAIQNSEPEEGDPVKQIEGLQSQKGELVSTLDKLKQIKTARGTEFLYLVSTLGAPREVSSQMPFFQGKEVIVKMRFEEDGLKVFQAEKDLRFNDNPLNENPIMTIPGEHVDFRCATNDQGECTGKEEKNEDIAWNQKKFFIPDFDNLRVEETNELTIFNDDFCFAEAKQKTIDYELTPDVMNIKVERSYEMKDSFICKILHYFEIAHYSLDRTSFKTQFMYSMVKLNKLASPGYKEVIYPVPDHRKFGFFKDKVTRLKGNFDPSRPETVYKLNRWNPENGKITYHLSATFNKPENLYLKDATYRAIDRINQSLVKANTGLQIELIDAPSKEEEKAPGDLRYSTIVLIDEPLANGLLGYGPSVTNPRTGEIIQAHTNMYSGVLRSGVRRSYEAMIRLQKKEKAAELAQQVQQPQAQDSGASQQSFDAPVEIRQQIDRDQLVSIANAYDKISQLNDKIDYERMQDRKQKLAQTQLNDFFSLQIKEKLTKGYEQNALKLHSDELFNRGMEYSEMIRIHSENNAYHIDMFNFTGLAKEIFPGVKEIPGILDDNGMLKPYKELTERQEQAMAKIVMVNTYTSTLVHEIGHNLGLRHNFSGSTDKENFFTAEEAAEFGLDRSPVYSSIMDYAYSDLNELSVFGNYDIAALRFAYAREIEKVKKLTDRDPVTNIPFTVSEEKEIVKVNKPLYQLEAEYRRKQNELNAQFDENSEEEKNKSYSYGRRRYAFCTDENAGLSALCNRFDEGTNVKEIAEHLVEHFEDRYYERNWRNDRDNFSVTGLERYIGRQQFWMMRLRKIYELYELYETFYGDLVAQGCSPDLTAQYPNVCNDINDIKDATIISGEYFLSILKTPDLNCAVQAGPQAPIEWIRLAEIYDEGQYSGIDDVPRNCFEPAVKEYMADPSNHLRRPLVVVGEVGKYLNSISDPDPKYPYAEDIKVRGVWVDKVLAARMLTDREDRMISVDDIKGSFIDIPALRTQIDNFFDHVLSGATLSNPAKVRLENGLEIPNFPTDLLVGSKQKVNETYWDETGMYFGLPADGSNYPLNRLLLRNSVWYGTSSDFDKYEESLGFTDKLKIKRQRSTDYYGKDDENQISMIVGPWRYIAQKQNNLAYSLIKNESMFYDFKDKVSVEVAKGVLTKRRLILQAQTGDTKVVLDNLKPEEIADLKAQLESLGDNVPPIDGLPPLLQSVVRLGVEGMQNCLDIIASLKVAPANSDEDVVLAFSQESDFLEKFVKFAELDDNGLKERRSSFNETLQLLSRY